MGRLTVSDISAAVALIVGLIGGIGYLHKSLKKYMGKTLEDSFNSIHDDIQGVKADIQEVKVTVTTLDLATCKNFLVRCLADMEKDVKLSDVEKERFWEQYQHYRECGGNTYIVEWTERLKREDKI